MRWCRRLVRDVSRDLFCVFFVLLGMKSLASDSAAMYFIRTNRRHKLPFTKCARNSECKTRRFKSHTKCKDYLEAGLFC